MIELLFKHMKTCLLTNFQEGIMSRIAWFTHLRVIFDNTIRAPYPMEFCGSRFDLLKRLIDSQEVIYSYLIQNLPLKSRNQYYTVFNEIGYSLKQVHFSILNIKSDIITWDNVMDAIIDLRVQ